LVINELNILRIDAQYKIFVEEAKLVWSSTNMYANILRPAKYPENRVRKVPKHFDNNYKDTNFSEEIKHKQIYFETLESYSRWSYANW